YIALSYCWGRSTTCLTTTTKTLPLHIKGIAPTSFPSLFQDVMDICRRLGIRYLWADALCILQDSTEDWQLEAAKMADV
ncbi:heterokaryon incompatibility, partial [Massariosphaeria phaeospora]